MNNKSIIYEPFWPGMNNHKMLINKGQGSITIAICFSYIFSKRFVKGRQNSMQIRFLSPSLPGQLRLQLN